MRILIATGIYPPDIGGPAKYAKNLKDQFELIGCEVFVLSYGIEKKLPIIFRQLYYIIRLMKIIRKVDCILALDIVSTGFPAVLLGKIFRKNVVTRVGGDYLWESYVNETNKLISIKQFNYHKPKFSIKLKIIEYMQSYVFKSSSWLVFNTIWIKNIFDYSYNLNIEKNSIIENFWPKKEKKLVAKKNIEKKFLFVGRNSKVKNIDVLKDIFIDINKKRNDISLEIINNESQDIVKQKMIDSYAIILPSIADVAPNVIAEALAVNKPCILTKETGLYKQLEDIVLFVNPYSSEEIKRKILFLADDINYKEYVDKIKQYNYVYTWKSIAKDFLNIFQNICN